VRALALSSHYNNCAEARRGFTDHCDRYIVAGVFTVGIAAIYTFLMGNPDKAQEVGGQYHPQAQSTEDKFKQRPDVRLEGTVSPAPGAK
jgi:hypothetical protein